ncbi:hypothetical protein [Tardiphaga sp. 709]|uniref:hypothetical protein n=1 Tax=Tardiphaga sp. 709 TaxID=3076039 RepID=UPI0028E391DC|nr:hypothetical protein [Tardiphaga sp. 709]WNV08195.1 hypothetical protein RSO67_22225 [Tardiphaga sp. 709]
MTAIDFLKLLLERSFSIGVFAIALFSVAALLDWKLKDSLKGKFLNSVYGRPSKSWTGELPTYYSAIHSLFGLGSFSKFLPRSIIATILMLACLSLLQAVVNEYGFETDTAPFFGRVLALDGRAAFIFVGIVTIDLISIYQTTTFLRISRGCQNVWEVIFLSIADVAISILLFIVIFPVFVTGAFFINVPKSKSFPILLSSTLTKQSSDLSSLRSFLIFDPRSKEDLSAETLASLLERKWHFRNYEISTFKGPLSAKLQDVVKGATSVGNILVQTKGIITDEKVFEVIIQTLKARPYTKSVNTIESVQNFYSAYAYVQLTVDNRITPNFFWRTYGGLIRQINFLDSDLLEVLTLNSPALSGNDAAFQYNLRSMNSKILREDKEQYIYCDGKYSVAPRTLAFDPDRALDRCDEAVAIDPVTFVNIRSLSLYEDAPSAIPISPLALSSLTATIMIYYLLVSKLVFRIVRPFFKSNLKDGEAFLRRHLLTISLVFLIALASPPLAILMHLLQ